jgi:signal transduction histidine kinase
MIGAWIRGLRGRLLIAFVLTSAVTLGVAAAVTLSPLQDRLRRESVRTFRTAVENTLPQFEEAARQGAAARQTAFYSAAFDLNTRTNARVAVWHYPPDFGVDTVTRLPNRFMTWAAVTAQLQGRQVRRVDENRVTIATPLLNGPGATPFVVVAQLPLTEVTGAVGQVRNALLAAAGVGLLVAVALAVALSSTLTRRLARLRAAALRITAEGPDAPAPRDAGRDEVGDLALALVRMQEELRRQEAARRSFVATASHELRTPLTMLQGTMELLEEDLRDGTDLGDALHQVESARTELDRLSALAGELLDLSRLDAAVQLRAEPVELGELARAVVAEFALRAAGRDVELRAEPPAEACWGRGDPDAVARVVRILLDNAMRYGPAGRPVEVSVARLADAATIDVADEGPGVPAEERERIFERFHRGRASTTTGGFGLGLAIGRELAERMGGSLTLVPGDGAGARFRLSVPAARTSSPARSPARGSAAAA